MMATILFADDQRRIRQYCKMELESAGYRVVLAGDGLDALDALDSIPVDLVVVDEHMPRCGGLETAKRIRQWYPQLPVILFTLDPDYEGYRSPLVDEAVIKSDDLKALKQAISRVLSKSQQHARTRRREMMTKEPVPCA